METGAFLKTKENTISESWQIQCMHAASKFASPPKYVGVLTLGFILQQQRTKLQRSGKDVIH
jgi:hypothetical protein